MLNMICINVTITSTVVNLTVIVIEMAMMLMSLIKVSVFMSEQVRITTQQRTQIKRHHCRHVSSGLTVTSTSTRLTFVSLASPPQQQ